MSDETDHEPWVNNQGFDVDQLNIETTGPLTGEFTAPVVKGTKPRWWESASKTRTKKPRERKRAATPKRDVPMPRGGFKAILVSKYTLAGTMMMPFDPGCGRIILENAEQCAESLDELARTNPAVRRALNSLIATSAWGAVIAAHAPIVAAISMHHVPALRKRQEKLIAEFGIGDVTDDGEDQS